MTKTALKTNLGPWGSDDEIKWFKPAPVPPHLESAKMSRKGKNPEILPFDPQDPESIYHMVPESLQQAMQLINPVWMCWKEATLAKNADADPRLIRLRLSFWDEYFAAKDQGRKMSIRRVWNGVCGEHYWRNSILSSPKKVAYLLSMPSDYEASIRAAHYMALAKMEEILKWPLKDRKGIPQVGVGDRVIKVFEILDNRIKGVATQRMQIEQKSLNVNVTQTSQEMPTNPKDIEAEIKRLEKQMKTLPASDLKPLQVEQKEVVLNNNEESHGE